MTIDRRALLGTLAATAAAPLPAPPAKTASAAEAAPESIPLWPGPAPGSPGSPSALPRPKLQKADGPGLRDYHLRGVAAPTMFVYRPERPNGVGLIVMPGGGYAFLSMEHEGSEIARSASCNGASARLVQPSPGRR